MKVGQNVHDKERSGRPSLITQDLKKHIDEQIQQYRRSTPDELYEKFPQISRSLHEILSKHLGYKKRFVQGWCHGCWQTTTEKNLCARQWRFWSVITETETKFLDHIVTGDETWVSHFTPESKRQSLEWHHPQSPSKPRKFKQTFSTRKIMATVFLGP
jgi:hypothetical protein